MAQGTFTLFNEYSKNQANGTHDLDTHTFKVALITTLPTASDSTPSLTDYTEVTGTGYTAGGITVPLTITQSANITYVDSTTNPAWTQDPAGPTNIKAGLLYNSTDTGKAAIGFVDITPDGGTTPFSLQAGNLTLTWNASGIYSFTN